MPARRTLLLIAACSLVMPWGIGAPVTAADAAATAFVTKIYDAYRGKDAKGVTTDTEADLRRYFEPSLVALIVKDEKAAARRKEVPTLDGDPFIDAQEWEVTGLDIAVTDAPPNKAVATVSFKNFGLPMKIVLQLVKAKNDWQIVDITWERGENGSETLRGLYKH